MSSGQPSFFLVAIAVFRAQRFAVHLVGAGDGAAVADDGAHGDDGRLVGDRLGGFNCRSNGVEIVAVCHVLHMPVIGLEALRHVLGEGQLGGAVERDEVVVVEEDQLAQLQGSGQRSRLMREAFHQIAVAADAVGVVIDDVEARLVVDGGQMLLGDGQADGHAEAPARAVRW